MQEQILKDTIEETQKTIEQSQDWQAKYEMQVNAMLDNRTIIEEFKKLTKDYEHLQFYLNEITQVDLFNVTVKFIGIDIATITISKDKVQITTEPYNKSNKELFNCELQLKQEEFNSPNTREFLEYFKGDIKLKNKPNKTQIDSMLLAEFAKTSSYNKLLTGIQPIRHGNLYYQIPISINPKATDQINILTRSKVRKITLIETLTDNEDLDTVSANATAKAIFLTHLLHSEQGEKWYKLFGFHGRRPPHLTIKVCIAVPKSSKIKEFKPFELRSGIDTLDYRYLEYTNDQEKITSINTNVNE